MLTQGVRILDVALAVGIPITTIVMTMITPHRDIGIGPVRGMTIGTFRDAIVAIATTTMGRDATAATLTPADLEALEEDVAVEIGEQGDYPLIITFP